MRLSVIVPFYNAEKTLQRCIESIDRSDFKDCEVLLVNDGSTDKSEAIAEQFNYRVLRSAVRKGPAFARNLGAANAIGDILLFLDSDVMVRPETLSELVKTYEKRADISGVSAIYSDKPIAPGLFQEFKALEETLKYQAYQADRYDSFDPHCASIKRDVFFEVGGFNTKYQNADTEDVEFGYELSKRYVNCINKAVCVDHIYSSFERNLWNYFKRTFLWTRLFLKKRRFDQAVTTPANAGSVMLAMLTVISFCFSLFSPAVAIFPMLIGYAYLLYHYPLWKQAWMKYGTQVFSRWPVYFTYAFSLHSAIGLGAALGFIVWPVAFLIRVDPLKKSECASWIQVESDTNDEVLV